MKYERNYLYITKRKFGNGYVISSLSLLGISVPISAGIKIKPYFKWGPSQYKDALSPV